MTPTSISRRTLIAGALLTTLAGCAGAVQAQSPATPASEGQSPAAPAAAPRTLAGHGYAVTVAPLDMVTAFGTDTIVRGTISSIGEPRRTKETSPDGQSFELVYVPVTVDTIKVFKGSDEVRGKTQITLRLLGGTADGLTFEFDEAAKPAQLPVGSEVIIFGGKFATVGEATPALTPNRVLIREGNDFRDISHGQKDGATIKADAILQRITDVYPS